MSCLLPFPHKQKSIVISGILFILILTIQYIYLFPPALANTKFAKTGGMVPIKKRLSTPNILVNRPIIFVHGINQDASKMGVPQPDSSDDAFVPLYRELQAVYGQIKTFYYVDDIAFGSSCLPKYSQCLSQSSVLDNAVLLAQSITSLYQATHHKVALIGYSMGAAIIRTALAGCLQRDSCTAEVETKIAQMVDYVFFINGVQEGSWLIQTLNGSPPPAISFLRNLLLGYVHFQMHLNEKRPAELDLKPGSPNILLHNSVPPPENIHYFNFYGDIHITIKGDVQAHSLFYDWHVKANLIKFDVGDLVILPGTDDPEEHPYWGGARFCWQCINQNFSNRNDNTSYMQWPLTDERQIDLHSLLTNCPKIAIVFEGCSMKNLSDLLQSIPETHFKIYSDKSLDGTDIQVVDRTGLNDSKYTGIAKEIALQLDTMPPTQTSCPATGSARAIEAVPLVHGNDQNIIYAYNAESNYVITAGSLKRYDVMTGNKSVVVQLPSISITNAQLSSDGQWILFLATQESGLTMLQMVRLDGQGLQTLYCFPPGSFAPTALWSPNQDYVALSFAQSSVPSPSYVYLLNISSSMLQLELTLPDQGISLNEWVGNSNLVMSFFGIGTEGGAITTLYILDTTKGTNQQESGLQNITYQSHVFQSITDYASSYDNLHFFISSAQAIGSEGGGISGYDGFGTILEQPLVGATQAPFSQATVYHNDSYAVTGLQVVDQQSLLFIIRNQNSYGIPDISHNGLWKINTDGTGLIQLTSDSPGQVDSFDRFVGTLWTNLSRDKSMYVIEVTNNQNQTNPDYMLEYGYLTGNQRTTFATTSFSDGSLSVVGWTTM